MPKKITQAQLSNLIAENINTVEINLKQLLEANGYKPDISKLYFDGKLLSTADSPEDRELYFSGLNLTDTSFVGLKALTVSFAGSNLTNASIQFRSVIGGVDFAGANLTSCYIDKIEAMSNNFTDAIVKDTMIFKKLTSNQSFFTPVQIAEIISLDIAPGAEFHQVDMMRRYFDELQTEGFCVGGGIEFARHNLKAKDRGETTENSSFIAKLTKKMANRSENFLKRVHDYQEQIFEVERMTFVNLNSLKNNNFINSLERKFDDTNLISCWMYMETGGHVFTVAKLKNSEGEVYGYNILDLNYGEIRCNLGSLQENQKKCNQQVHLLYKSYQAARTVGDKVFTVTDLDKLIQDYELVKPKDKYKKSDKYLDKVVPSLRRIEAVESTKSHVDRLDKKAGSIENKSKY